MLRNFLVPLFSFRQSLTGLPYLDLYPECFESSKTKSEKSKKAKTTVGLEG